MTKTKATIQCEVDSSFESLLREVVSLLKQGKFNAVLQGKVDRLWSAIKSTDTRQKADYYKAAAIISEVRLYFGARDDAMSAIQNPSALFDSLQKSNPTNEEERVLAREQLRAYQAWIHAALYYDHDYKPAKEKFEFCRDFVNTKLCAHAPNRHYGTKAQTEFLIGKVLRQLHSYSLSEKALVASIEFYNRRSELRKTDYENRIPSSADREALIRDEAIFLNRKIAVSTLALVWLDYTRGRLSLAQREAEIAKGLLIPCEDPINEACLDWMRSSILRCRANSADELMEAIRIATQAEKTLAGFEKHPYLPRIKYEKALINLALVRWPTQRVGEYLQQAWKQAKYVREWNPKDTRWKANSLIIMSRVRREEKECDKAIQYSTDALELIEKERNGGRNHILCEIDAYIARAEASILKARLDIEKENRVTLMGSQLLRETRKDLHQALRLNEKSEIPRTADTQDEKTFAVAWLNISRSHVIGREKWHAELAFRRWKDVEAIVEHRGVHAFARKVRREIDSFGDFIIPEDEPDLDYRHHEANLRAHLIRTVQQRMPDQTQKEWAKELKITRQSFIKWSRPNQNKNNSG